MVIPIRKSSELLAKNLFRLQYASDLHLESNRINDFSQLIKPIAPFLALVGDIGHITSPTYKPFFDYISNEFEQVYYVPGNHEYYNPTKKHKTDENVTMYQLNHQMKNFCDSYKNVHYLYRNSIKLNDFNVGIIGSPLWTPYFSSKKIFVSKDKTLDSDYANYLHQLDITYIDDRCRKLRNTNSKIIILTHFIPSFSLILNKYKNYPNKDNFASGSDFLFYRFPINCWIYGHTHHSSTQSINKTLCLTNPYGNKNQYETNGFCDQMFVEFKLSTNEEEDKPNYLSSIIEDYHLINLR